MPPSCATRCTASSNSGLRAASSEPSSPSAPVSAPAGPAEPTGTTTVGTSDANTDALPAPSLVLPAAAPGGSAATGAGAGAPTGGAVARVSATTTHSSDGVRCIPAPARKPAVRDDAAAAATLPAWCRAAAVASDASPTAAATPFSASATMEALPRRAPDAAGGGGSADDGGSGGGTVAGATGSGAVGGLPPSRSREENRDHVPFLVGTAPLPAAATGVPESMLPPMPLPLPLPPRARDDEPTTEAALGTVAPPAAGAAAGVGRRTEEVPARRPNMPDMTPSNSLDATGARAGAVAAAATAAPLSTAPPLPAAPRRGDAVAVVASLPAAAANCSSRAMAGAADGPCRVAPVYNATRRTRKSAARSAATFPSCPSGNVTTTPIHAMSRTPRSSAAMLLKGPRAPT